MHRGKAKDIACWILLLLACVLAVTIPNGYGFWAFAVLIPFLIWDHYDARKHALILGGDRNVVIGTGGIGHENGTVVIGQQGTDTTIKFILPDATIKYWTEQSAKGVYPQSMYLIEALVDAEVFTLEDAIGR